MPYRNKNGAEKTFNARLPFASSGRLRQGLRGVSPPPRSSPHSGKNNQFGVKPITTPLSPEICCRSPSWPFSLSFDASGPTRIRVILPLYRRRRRRIDFETRGPQFTDNLIHLIGVLQRAQLEPHRLCRSAPAGPPAAAVAVAAVA